MCSLSGAGRALQGASYPIAFLGQLTIVRWGSALQEALLDRLPGSGLLLAPRGHEESEADLCQLAGRLLHGLHQPRVVPREAGSHSGSGWGFWDDKVALLLDPLLRCFLGPCLVIVLCPTQSFWLEGDSFSSRALFSVAMGTKDLFLRSPLASLPVTCTLDKYLSPLVRHWLALALYPIIGHRAQNKLVGGFERPWPTVATGGWTSWQFCIRAPAPQMQDSGPALMLQSWELLSTNLFL